MKKNAIVNLQGGLGNQIFQIAFALDLISQDIRTYCDVHFFDSNMQFPRNLEISPDLFEIKTIKFKSNKIFSILGTLFQENDTFDSNDFRFLNRFTGYYQDFVFIEKHIEKLQKSINIKYDSHLNEKVAIHIRQSDYKTIKQDLNNEYYIKSITNFLEGNQNLTFDIFTDDINFIPNLKIFKNLDKVFYPDEYNKPLEVFRKMSSYQNFIIANSSFSALSAYLSISNNKKVVYPNPWWRSSKIHIKNIPTSWIPICNK